MNASLKALQIKAKQQVYTLLSGQNLSALHGEGHDFSEIREYQDGDDIRNIHWMTTAKLGKPYTKVLHVNRELSIVVATLMDASFYFGLGNRKQRKLTEVATLLGYVAQQNNDLFSGFCYTQNETYSTPPTKQLYHIEEFSKILFNSNLLRTTLNVTVSIENLFNQIHRPSLVFIIGDFLKPIDFSLLAQKHEIIAIVIRDEEEEFPRPLGEIMLCNPQNNDMLQTNFGTKSIKNYLKALKKNDQKLIEHFSHFNIRYTKISTNDEAIKKLLYLF